MIGYRRVARGRVLDGRRGGRCGTRGLRGGVDAVVAVSGPARWYYRGTRPMRQVHWAIERPVGPAGRPGGQADQDRGGAVGPGPAARRTRRCAHIAPTPLLIVHGDADAFFPLEHAHQLYAAAREPKELWVEPGYGHAETAATPALIRRIGEWIRTSLTDT